MALVIVTLAACGDGGPGSKDALAQPREPRPADAVTATIAGFTLAMCACPDATCAERVHDTFTAWGTDVARTSTTTPDAQGAEPLARYTECMMRAMTASLVDRAPELVAVSPAHGDALGGSYVVLKGRRFPAGGPRRAQVYFGARQGTVVRFASTTELIVEAPGGIAGENVDVRVVFDPGGPAVLANAFTFSRSP